MIYHLPLHIEGVARAFRRVMRGLKLDIVDVAALVQKPIAEVARYIIDPMSFKYAVPCQYVNREALTPPPDVSELWVVLSHVLGVSLGLFGPVEWAESQPLVFVRDMQTAFELRAYTGPHPLAEEIELRRAGHFAAGVVRYHLANRGIPSNTLARFAGVSCAAVHQVLRTAHCPPPLRSVAWWPISVALGISLEELSGGSEEWVKIHQPDSEWDQKQRKAQHRAPKKIPDEHKETRRYKNTSHVRISGAEAGIGAATEDTDQFHASAGEQSDEQSDNQDPDDQTPPPPFPTTRKDCEQGPRPCPWYRCKYHLHTEVKPARAYPHNPVAKFLLDPDDWTEDTTNCVLDIVERSGGEMTLDEVGFHFNITRERVRQIEHSALEKLQEAGIDLREYLEPRGGITKNIRPEHPTGESLGSQKSMTERAQRTIDKARDESAKYLRTIQPDSEEARSITQKLERELAHKKAIADTSSHNGEDQVPKQRKSTPNYTPPAAFPQKDKSTKRPPPVESVPTVMPKAIHRSPASTPTVTSTQTQTPKTTQPNGPQSGTHVGNPLSIAATAKAEASESTLQPNPVIPFSDLPEPESFAKMQAFSSDQSHTAPVQPPSAPRTLAKIFQVTGAVIASEIAHATTMTQQQLAAHIGTTPWVLSKMLDKPKQRTSFDLWNRLFRAIGTNAETIAQKAGLTDAERDAWFACICYTPKDPQQDASDSTTSADESNQQPKTTLEQNVQNLTTAAQAAIPVMQSVTGKLAQAASKLGSAFQNASLGEIQKVSQKRQATKASETPSTAPPAATPATLNTEQSQAPSPDGNPPAPNTANSQTAILTPVTAPSNATAPTSPPAILTGSMLALEAIGTPQDMLLLDPEHAPSPLDYTKAVLTQAVMQLRQYPSEDPRLLAKIAALETERDQLRENCTNRTADLMAAQAEAKQLRDALTYLGAELAKMSGHLKSLADRSRP